MLMNMMNMLSVRKLATLTIYIIIIGFFILSLQVVITWHMRLKRGHEVFNSSLAGMITTPSFSKEYSETFENYLQQEKIEQIKRDLNDPTLINEALFPINKIGRYIFFNPNLCKSASTINIIIIVHSALPHFDRRRRIRTSFAKSYLFYPIQIRVAFLLGKTDSIALMRRLWEEHIVNKDTVMGDFIDDYHNLSIKGVMGYGWVKDYCPNADFVLKIDDDVIINMFRLIDSLLPQMKNKKRSIFCNLWHKGTMPILREDKWKVASHIFPTRRLYPYDYCSGFTVIMTSDLMDPLYRAAKITPYFWIDDIYLYGMLPYVAGNVSYHRQALNRNVTLSYEPALSCTLTMGVRCPIFSTIISDYDFWYYWKLIKDTYLREKARLRNG